jgi:hypothetical protein
MTTTANSKDNRPKKKDGFSLSVEFALNSKPSVVVIKKVTDEGRKAMKALFEQTLTIITHETNLS